MIAGLFIAGIGSVATWIGYKTHTPALVAGGVATTGLGGAVAF